MVDRGHDFAGIYRTLDRVGADLVALPDHAPAFDAAAGEIDRPALRPMIAAARGIDLGCATEFGKVADQCGVEQAALGEILNQRAVAPVIHRRDDFLHALDRSERFRAVNVPGDFIEDGDERVDGDKADAGLHQAPRQQTALAEASQAIAFADGLRLLGQVESIAGPGARHQAIRGGETGVHQLRVRACLKVPDRLVHDVAQLASSPQAGLADLLGRQQVGHLEIFPGRIGVEHERIKPFAEETGVLAVRQVAAGRAHRLGKDDVSGQFVAPPLEVLQSATGVRGVDPAGEEPAGLHHLMAGVMHRRRVVITTADQRELVRDLRVQGEYLGELYVRVVRPDRLERPAYLTRRVRLHIPGVQLARRAQIEDHDYRLLVLAFGHGAQRLQRGQI